MLRFLLFILPLSPQNRKPKQMRSNYIIVIAVFSALLFTKCTTTKQTPKVNTDPSVQKYQDANSAFNSGDFQKALANYEEIIAIKSSQNKRVDSTIYQNAGIAAW